MTRISALLTRLGLPSKMKIHNVLHFDIQSTAYVTGGTMVMTRSSGVQVQVWTRLGLLSTIKTRNFFHIHLLVPYRVTEADATPHS
jgi:hypothetical protein